MRALAQLRGKDAFHRVPDFARNDWDAVERVPTERLWRAQPGRRCRPHAPFHNNNNNNRKKVSNV